VTFKRWYPLLLLASTTPVSARTLAASGSWAALERQGGYCEAIARTEAVAPRGEEQARLTLAFDRPGPRRGELHARLSRPARPGAQAMLTIGTDQFLLVTRGADAWSRGPAQEQAIIAAMRRGSRLRIQWQSEGGRRFSDYYSLAGAPTAIDAAAAGCQPVR
jgi:hypothetical protein